MDDDKKLSIDQQREVERQWDILQRGVVEIVPEEQLRKSIINSVAT